LRNNAAYKLRQFYWSTAVLVSEANTFQEEIAQTIFDSFSEALARRYGNTLTNFKPKNYVATI
jgi:ABC-type transporter MlaC component